MTNSSGITPVGHRLLVLPEQVEEKTESGIIINSGTALKLEDMAQTFGTVVAMGETCYNDQPSAWCKVGDRVSFAKYSGLLNTGADGQKYRVINDLDVVAIVSKEVK